MCCSIKNVYLYLITMHAIPLSCKVDTPPNSLKDSNVNLKVKIVEEKGVGVCSLVCNTSKVGRPCWSFRMGTKMNSQVKVQNENNLHNQERGWLVSIEWKWCGRLSRDNFKHKFYIARNFWEEALLPSL
jgi:hypothetical protein